MTDIKNLKTHWDTIYELKHETDFSWFQRYPKTSLEFIQLFNLPKDARIIDVGGGDSHFIDALIERGYSNLYVLDISSKAIQRAKSRLAGKAQFVHWIVSDVMDFSPDVQFDFWHDRAAFHFLTTASQIIKYVAIVTASLKARGHLVLGTFSDKGPTTCSGLEIKQYTVSSMSSLLERKFKRIKCIEETHLTPSNKSQEFIFCSFQKIASPIL